MRGMIEMDNLLGWILFGILVLTVLFVVARMGFI
jgi:hypothetical protein